MAKPKTRPTRREPTYAAVAKPVAVEAPPAAPAPAPPPAVDVRGRNVSGRPWKQPPKSRSSSLKMTQPRKSWDAKKRDREARQRAREKEAELVEARKERIAEQKRKTEEKRSRKRRNEFRNAQYQVITNDKTVKVFVEEEIAPDQADARRGRRRGGAGRRLRAHARSSGEARAGEEVRCFRGGRAGRAVAATAWGGGGELTTLCYRASCQSMFTVRRSCAASLSHAQLLLLASQARSRTGTVAPAPNFAALPRRARAGHRNQSARDRCPAAAAFSQHTHTAQQHCMHLAGPRARIKK